MHLLWEHRYLTFFGFLIVTAFLWEIYSPDSVADRTPDGYPDVILELYPDTPRSYFLRGFEAMYSQGDLVKAKKYFEQALRTGNKMNENLLYHYARCLYLLEFPDEQVREAVQQWEKNFPHSLLPDPRSLGKQL